MEYLAQLRRAVRDDIVQIGAVQDLIAGKADRDVYVRYLTNVWHYAQHSAIVIGIAGARAVGRNPPVADYLLHHAREELGHDEWALGDLAALGVSRDDVAATRPVPACAAMIGYEYYTATYANPVGLFGWLFVLEAMGEDLGHLIAEQVGKGLALPDGVRFLAGHGEADQDHTKDIIEQIEAHIVGQDLADVHHVADVMADIYPRMLREATQRP